MDDKIKRTINLHYISKQNTIYYNELNKETNKYIIKDYQLNEDKYIIDQEIIANEILNSLNIEKQMIDDINFIYTTDKILYHTTLLPKKTKSILNKVKKELEDLFNNIKEYNLIHQINNIDNLSIIYTRLIPKKIYEEIKKFESVLKNKINIISLTDTFKIDKTNKIIISNFNDLLIVNLLINQQLIEEVITDKNNLKNIIFLILGKHKYHYQKIKIEEIIIDVEDNLIKEEIKSNLNELNEFVKEELIEKNINKIKTKVF